MTMTIAMVVSRGEWKVDRFPNEFPVQSPNLLQMSSLEGGDSQ